jgi:hypothetical protein
MARMAKPRSEHCPKVCRTQGCGIMLGVCLTQVRLLRPTRIGILPRSFRLHSPRYARVTIVAICSMGVALATAPLSQTDSKPV